MTLDQLLASDERIEICDHCEAWVPASKLVTHQKFSSICRHARKWNALEQEGWTLGAPEWIAEEIERAGLPCRHLDHRIWVRPETLDVAMAALKSQPVVDLYLVHRSDPEAQAHQARVNMMLQTLREQLRAHAAAQIAQWGPG